MNGSIISLNLTLEETDVVLNALEEKALSVSRLREKLYNDANQQVIMIKQGQAEVEHNIKPPKKNKKQGRKK